MNENDSTNADSPGFFGSILSDDGVHRAAAGVVVAIVVAGAKHMLFSKAG